MIRSIRFSLLVLSLCLIPLHAQDSRLNVVISGAVLQYPRNASLPHDLMDTTVDFVLQGTEVAETAWASALNFNRSEHRGRVTEQSWKGNQLSLTYELQYNGDNWIRGGRGRYALTLELPDEPGPVTGTFTGEYQGIPLKGTVSGQLLPPQQTPEGFRPIQPGEHPRLLFRAHELDAVKARLETSLGKALWPGIVQGADQGSLICMGFVYAVTGDQTYAEKARLRTIEYMKDRSGGAFALGAEWGPRLYRVGHAFDLCYDAWDEDFRKQVVQYLYGEADRITRRPHLVSHKFNTFPVSNYHAHTRPGAGVALMAILYEPTEPPREPIPPNENIPAPKPESAVTGAPTLAFEAEAVYTDWLFAGPFPLDYRSPEDPLASVGGVAKLRPQAGAKVRFKDTTREWTLITPESHATYYQQNGNTRNLKALNLQNLCQREPNQRLFFFANLKVENPGFYQFQGNFWQAACYLSGERIADGMIVKLEKGTYPFMVPVVMGNPTGYAFPRFLPATKEKARQAVRVKQSQWETEHAAWQRAYAQWEANHGSDPNINFVYEWNERICRQYYEMCFGDGGFGTEGSSYTVVSMEVPWRYAAAYKVMNGVEISPTLNDNTHLLLQVARGVYDVTGEPPQVQGFSVTAYGIHMEDMAEMIGAVPEAWKPAALWGLNQQMGLARDAEGNIPALTADNLDQVNLLSGEKAVHFLLEYPWGMEPENPAEVLPRVWVDQQKGGVVFRNEWKGPQDIVALAWSKRASYGGWTHPDAGTLRIQGLGHIWMDKGPVPGKLASRWQESVIHIPDNPGVEGAPGFLTRLETDEQGGGSVAMDLRLVYNQPLKSEPYEKYDRKKKKRVITTRDLNTLTGMREPIWEHVDLKVNKAMRVFAADFTGKSGAPAVFVLSDDLQGPGEKIWQWQLPKGTESRLSVEMKEKGFVLLQGKARMEVTFVEPANVKVERASGGVLVATGRDNQAGVKERASLHSIHARNADDDTQGRFVAVAVLSEGEAPAVSGNANRIRVGRQTYRVDEDVIEFK